MSAGCENDASFLKKSAFMFGSKEKAITFAPAFRAKFFQLFGLDITGGLRRYDCIDIIKMNKPRKNLV